MPGPCPQGASPLNLHARCQDRGNCTGPGCRVHRPARWRWAKHPVTGDPVKVPA